MKKTINNNTLQEIDISALLNSFVYMDQWALWDSPYDRNGCTLEMACEKLATRSLSEEQQSFLESIRLTLEAHPEYKRIVILDQNCNHTDLTMDSYAFSKDHLIAAAFRYGDDYYVAYRGTGDGKWIDNAEAFTTEQSSMQKAAQEYFDFVVETYGLAEADGKVFVTGHSKGGNSAQYVTMTSEYAEIIDGCYSLDGQGFSEKAIAAFRKRWKDAYAEQLSKMYSVNVEHDYVHDLGLPIIPEDQTYFVHVNGSGGGVAENLIAFHDLRYMLAKDGSLAWDYAKDGSVNFEYLQSEFGLFVRDVSGALMKLEEEELNDTAISVMSAMEIGIGGGVGTGDVSMATLKEIFGSFGSGIPLFCEVWKESGHTEGIWIVAKEIPAGGMAEQVIVQKTSTVWERLFDVDWSNQRAVDELNELFSEENIANVAALGAVLNAKLEDAEDTTEFISQFPFTELLVQMIYMKTVTDFLIENREKIMSGIEYTAEKLMNAMSAYIEGKANQILASVCKKAEKNITTLITITGIIDDAIYASLDELEMAVQSCLKAFIAFHLPMAYIICTVISKSKRYDVEINVKVLRETVQTLNALVIRVQNMDRRLNTLYERLAQNNVELEEGIFTSIANLFNLFRADICVDQAGAVRRRANSLAEFLEEGDRLERRFLENL